MASDELAAPPSPSLQREVDVQFERAALIVQSLPSTGSVKLTTEDKLMLYALYKQSTANDCSLQAPALWDLPARAKWNAWNALRGESSFNAKQKYIDLFAGFLHRFADQPQVQKIIERFTAPLLNNEEETSLDIYNLNGDGANYFSATLPTVDDQDKSSHHTNVTPLSNSISSTTSAMQPESSSQEWPHLSISLNTVVNGKSNSPNSSHPQSLSSSISTQRAHTSCTRGNSPIFNDQSITLVEAQNALQVMQARIAALQEQAEAFYMNQNNSYGVNGTHSAKNNHSNKTIKVTGRLRWLITIVLRHIIIDTLLGVCLLWYLHKRKSPLAGLIMSALRNTLVQKILQRFIKV